MLHEARLIIEMSPGTMVFFPSAVITHEVTPIEAHEERMSVTAYTAGGLFRFLDQGMTTASKDKLSKVEAAKKVAAGAARWVNGLGRFLTIPQLLDYHSVARAMYGD